MAEYTAIAVQNVAANANVLFTETAVAPSRCIVHREGSGIVTLRGLTKNQPRALFRVRFGGNVAIPTGGAVVPIVLAISVGGEALGEATAIATIGAAGSYFHIGAETIVCVPAGCCQNITIKNIGDGAIDVQNANLIVERIA